ncbi:hypothetical protein PSEUBRA_006046 [Kalmanozyma brasiliensis GHG001]|uniref:uncharacterized protein n=1 Tax=Kalmanozyma brasiliensis (strain GHG001) TaxID=1365824 RepID=UPI001CEA1E80|nr:uncharacterized protein PSEUBRA_006046 [Kalmanozyma brasiliensis GHG001]KAF6767604.1 hypothetical protein PSEUBRA_006046 [Kalmanozyma brasiliensis GHG001]
MPAISAPGPPNLDDFEPRELDQADFDFLHSLANEPPLPPHDPVHSLVNENPLPSHEPRPAPSIPEREAFSSSAVSAYPAVEQNLEPFPASAAWVDPRWDRSFRHRREATRSNVGWAAPRELLGLGHWKGLKEHGFSHARDFADTLATRARINELFFANKITWVDLRPFTRRNSQWFHRSPLVRVSQRLPLVRIVGKDGLPRRVYVTEHNVVTNRGSELKGTALDGVPFFSFWSVPEREADKEHETLFLGSGYLHARDNDAVDEHLRRVLEAAEPVEIRI